MISALGQPSTQLQKVVVQPSFWKGIAFRLLGIDPPNFVCFLFLSGPGEVILAFVQAQLAGWQGTRQIGPQPPES